MGVTLGPKSVGPSFMSEARAAGLAGLPWTIGADANAEMDMLTPAQQQTLRAVYAAHDPTRPDPEKAQQDADDAERRIALGNLVTAHRDWDTLGTAARWAAVRLCIRVVILIARRLLQ